MAIQRTANGFEFTTAQNVKARMDGSDVLELRETPTSTALMANGKDIFTIDTPDGLAPVYGIIAVGAGRFAYTGFEIVEQAPEAPSPSPGGQRHSRHRAVRRRTVASRRSRRQNPVMAPRPVARPRRRYRPAARVLASPVPRKFTMAR